MQNLYMELIDFNHLQFSKQEDQMPSRASGIDAKLLHLVKQEDLNDVTCFIKCYVFKINAWMKTKKFNSCYFTLNYD